MNPPREKWLARYPPYLHVICNIIYTYVQSRHGRWEYNALVNWTILVGFSQDVRVTLDRILFDLHRYHHAGEFRHGCVVCWDDHEAMGDLCEFIAERNVTY